MIIDHRLAIICSHPEGKIFEDFLTPNHLGLARERVIKRVLSTRLGTPQRCYKISSIILIAIEMFEKKNLALIKSPLVGLLGEGRDCSNVIV